MRCTLAGEIPARRASSRLDQCVEPSGTSSRVRTITSSTWASVMVRGTPGRGSSPSPSSRRARNRARHMTTVPRLTPSRAATAVLLPPSAQASTIRARSAAPRAVLQRRDQFSKVRRSSSDSTSGANRGSGISPADRTATALSPPDHRSETRRDSSGDRRTQDRDTRPVGQLGNPDQDLGFRVRPRGQGYLDGGSLAPGLPQPERVPDAAGMAQAAGTGCGERHGQPRRWFLAGPRRRAPAAIN
jgi:hypothetical protein